MRRCAALLLVPLLAGCAAWQTPAAFPREFETAFNQIGTSITSQAIWDNMDARLSGQADNPGLEFYYTVTTAIGTRIRNVAGQFALGAQGHGIGELPPELAEALLKLGMENVETRQALVAWWIDTFGRAAEGEPTTQPNQ